MKTIIESISTSRIDEAREIEYNVSIIGVVDDDDMPVNVKIFCPKEYQKKFEAWLENEEGNSFEHAEGGNVEY